VIGGLAPGISGEQVFEVAADRGACRCRGAGEEFGIDLSVEVDDDAVKIEREEVSAQEAARVDDGVPGLADGAGRGEPAWLETAEHFGEHVVGQQPRQVVVVPLLAPASLICSGFLVLFFLLTRFLVVSMQEIASN
jgi:hypothetical protein